MNYLRQGKRVLRIQRSALRGEGPAELALRTRSVSQAELAEGLGVLATELGKVELAHFYLDRALEADPFLARARAGMGRVLELQERWEEAEVQHGYAVELDPGDALNHLDAGRFWHGRAASNDDVRQRQAWLEQARAHYERSLQLDPACPETWAGLGSLILDARTSPERGVELLEHAHALLPGNFEIALRLGTAYVDARRYTEARQTLEPLVVHDLAPADARRIQTLLTTIAGAGA